MPPPLVAATEKVDVRLTRCAHPTYSAGEGKAVRIVVTQDDGQKSEVIMYREDKEWFWKGLFRVWWDDYNGLVLFVDGKVLIIEYDFLMGMQVHWQNDIHRSELNARWKYLIANNQTKDPFVVACTPRVRESPPSKNDKMKLRRRNIATEDQKILIEDEELDIPPPFNRSFPSLLKNVKLEPQESPEHSQKTTGMSSKQEKMHEKRHSATGRDAPIAGGERTGEEDKQKMKQEKLHKKRHSATGRDAPIAGGERAGEAKHRRRFARKDTQLQDGALRREEDIPVIDLYSDSSVEILDN